jgi:hypothetical protein
VLFAACGVLVVLPTLKDLWEPETVGGDVCRDGLEGGPGRGVGGGGGGGGGGLEGGTAECEIGGIEVNGIENESESRSSTEVIFNKSLGLGIHLQKQIIKGTQPTHSRVSLLLGIWSQIRFINKHNSLTLHRMF